MRLIRAYRGILCKLSLCTAVYLPIFIGPRGNPEPRPAQEEKHGIDTNKLALTTIADTEPTMRKRQV